MEFNSYKAFGKVDIPSSKSYSHRALIIAFIKNEKITIKNISLCDDVLITLEALKVLGGVFKLENNDVIFYKREKVENKEIIIDCFDSGSTLRFLLPLASYLYDNVTFRGSERLFSRPLNVYFDILDNEKIRYIKSKNSLKIIDRFIPKNYEINADTSSQFVTGLLFLNAICLNNFNLKIKNDIASKGYVDLSVDVLNKFGYIVDFKDNTFTVNKKEDKHNSTFEIEKDFSSFAYFAVLGILKGRIEIPNMNENSLQPDKQIIDVIKLAGGDVSFIDGTYIFTNKNELKPFCFDISSCIDLGPIVMVLASLINGKSIIKGISRLKYKESDRAKTLKAELEKVNIEILLNEDSCEINGKQSIKQDVVFDSHNDHRIAMALSIFASKNEGKTEILNSSCVDKSFPDFYRILLNIAF